MSAPVGRPRALVTLPDVAWPVDGGKRLRCAGVLRGLAAVADVDVAFLHSDAPADLPPVPPDVPVHRWTRSSPAPLPRPRAAVEAVRRALPVHIAAQRWDVVRDELRAWTGDRRYDLVWFGGLDHAQALRGALHADRRVVDCDDVETEKWRAYLAGPSTGTDRVERLQRRLELPLWARVQRDVLSWSDAVVVCSDVDAERLGGGGSVAVVPNTYPDPGPPARRRPPQDPVAVVVANYATPQNRDAARAAVLGVLPELRARHPRARLRLVGREADRLDDLRGAEGLDLVGPVVSVAEELSRATGVVVPMRFGGGTRLKVLEAFAHGVPVVSTSLGCEGVGAEDGVHLLVRDDAASTAEALLALHDDPAAADALASRARRHYEDRFRPDASTRAVAGLVRRVLPGREPPTPTPDPAG